MSLCIDAAKELGLPARVVSMPCTDLFDEQSLEYRKSVLLEGVPVMAVEMLAAWGWERYSHVQHGMTTFGMCFVELFRKRMPRLIPHDG